MRDKYDFSKSVKKPYAKKVKKNIVYTDEPMDFKIVDDFLPPPSELVFKEGKVKITGS